MNIFNDSSKEKQSVVRNQLTPRQIGAKKIKRVMRAASSLQAKTPESFLKQRHLLGVTGFKVSTVVARLPITYIKSDLQNSHPWWTAKEVERPISENELTDAKKIGETNTFLVETQQRVIKLLNGETIKIVKKIFYDKDNKRRYKELYTETKDKQLVSYNSIPKHLMPLDGIDVVKVEADKEIIVVEGYPAAEALRTRKRNAVGIMSGTFDAPSERTLAPLLNAKTIYLWPDNDSAGVHHMQVVARKLHRMGAKEGQISFIRWLGGPRRADAFDFGGDERELDKLIAKSTTWNPEIRRSTNGVLRISPPRGSAKLSLSHRLKSPTPKITPVNKKKEEDPRTRLISIFKDIAKKTVSGDPLTENEKEFLQYIADSQP